MCVHQQQMASKMSYIRGSSSSRSRRSSFKASTSAKCQGNTASELDKQAEHPSGAELLVETYHIVCRAAGQDISHRVPSCGSRHTTPCTELRVETYRFICRAASQDISHHVPSRGLRHITSCAELWVETYHIVCRAAG